MFIVELDTCCVNFYLPVYGISDNKYVSGENAQICIGT